MDNGGNMRYGQTLYFKYIKFKQYTAKSFHCVVLIIVTFFVQISKNLLLFTLQHRELKKEQIEAMCNLCLDQYKCEHDLQMKYHPQLYDLLANLMNHSHEDHLKKLDQIHDKEVYGLNYCCPFCIIYVISKKV